MLTLALLVILTIAIFITAFVSPQHGTRVQHKSAQVHNDFKKRVRTSPKPIKQAATHSSELSHKAVTKTAQTGKKSRKKLS